MAVLARDKILDRVLLFMREHFFICSTSNIYVEFFKSKNINIINCNYLSHPEVEKKQMDWFSEFLFLDNNKDYRLLSFSTLENYLLDEDINPFVKNFAPFGDLFLSEVEEIFGLEKTNSFNELEWLIRENNKTNILREIDPSKTIHWLGYLGWQKKIIGKFHSKKTPSKFNNLEVCSIREVEGLVR